MTSNDDFQSIVAPLLDDEVLKAVDKEHSDSCDSEDDENPCLACSFMNAVHHLFHLGHMVDDQETLSHLYYTINGDTLTEIMVVNDFLQNILAEAVLEVARFRGDADDEEED